MNTLPQTTQRRLQNIPQIPSVWEGDRRSFAGIGPNLENTEENGECVIWVDGSEGFVRAMEIVSPESGPEAVVRTLLKAIEHPHSPAQPAKPQKIVVRNREIQFFLRGALQGLDIAIDYVPDLPLIDELFRSFEQSSSTRPPRIPPEYERQLNQTAAEIWRVAPWQFLADHDIMSITIDLPDLATIYACVMGMLGKEYGVILYRSLDSLKRFRAAALTDQSLQQLEQAFLGQDCWFLNFEPADPEFELEDEEDFDLAELPLSQIRPLFGSVHPYEGIRPFLDREEAKVIYLALQALQRFCRESRRELARETIGSLSKCYRLPTSPDKSASEVVSVTVSTQPQVTDELLEMLEIAESEEEEYSRIEVPIHEDFVPAKSLLSLSILPWDTLAQLYQSATVHLSTSTPLEELTDKGQGMPAILIQTSRPKAKELIDKIERAGGLQTICFNPGEDPIKEVTYALGIVQTNNGDLHLCGEFISDDPQHARALKQWQQGCQKTKGVCALVVAMGAMGASRGQPQLKDMVALWEAKATEAEELGLGILELMPHFRLEWE